MANKQYAYTSVLATTNELFTDTVYASTTSGEMMFLHSTNSAGELKIYLSPFKYALEGIRYLSKGFIEGLKNKHILLPAAALPLIWSILTLLQTMGIRGGVLNALNFLTFAQGGYGKGWVTALGGTVGKGVVSYFIINFIFPLFKEKKAFAGIAKGFTTLFSSFKMKRIDSFRYLLFGAGAALIAYNFIAGIASSQNSMVAVAAFLISLKALTQKAGFLRGFLMSIANKYSKGSTLNMNFINNIMAGWTAGFVIAIAISALNMAYACYVAGAIAAIIGLVMQLTGKDAKKGAKAV